MSSIRETAERIAERHHPSQTLTQNAGLIADIERELRNERKRAARIAKNILPIGADDCYWCERVKTAVAAIRKDD